MSIRAEAGSGNTNSPASSRSPSSGASASRDDRLDLRPAQPARLDERHERRRRVLVDLDRRVLVLDRREVGVGPDRRRRRDHPDPPVARRQRRGHRPGPDDAEDRQVVAPPEVAEGDRGRRVAGDDDRLDVARRRARRAPRSRRRGPRRRGGRRTARERCRRDRSSTRRAIRRRISRRTVSPPTPESKTPIGRGSDTSAVLAPAPRRRPADPVDREELARRRARRPG